jgi:hypothetical protein
MRYSVLVCAATKAQAAGPERLSAFAKGYGATSPPPFAKKQGLNSLE